LRALRLAQNVTQPELAARAGLNPRTIHNIETKAHTASLDSVVRVAMSLGAHDQLQHVFELQIQSIADMQRAEGVTRQRARPKRVVP
jgi:transcriptional regulator with XRE-family HTH domain